MSIQITKRDGSKEAFNADRINQSIARACKGLKDETSKVMQIATETELQLYDGISTQEMDEATISSAVQNIKENIDFDIVAKRLLLKTVYKQILGEYNEDNFSKLYKKAFKNYVKAQLKTGLLDKRLAKYDLDKLADSLKLERDELLNYTGLSTLLKRYILRNKDQKYLETPQFFWMRVAMGMALNEKDLDKVVIDFYNKMSALEYIPGGSTNISAGTSSPRLSNCYLMDMEDDISHIGKTVSDVMKLSKATGGIGLSVSKLRASGSPIKSSNTFSSGPIPFLHIIDSTIRAISRAGKKMGALCFYMENWHLDFPEFLDLKENSGDDYRRTRTANTAVYISDEFMKRVKNNEYWYLFDPQDTPELIESYGKEFSKHYEKYVEKAEAGKIKRYQRIRAKEQWRSIIVSLQTTSHPWITFKDPINERALNNNTGVIHCSNLCTEITLPQDKNNVSVCNLLSINLAKHKGKGKDIDWDKLKDSVSLAIRQLDNLVDINEPPIPEAKNFDSHNRAIGLGVMGLSDLLEQLELPYNSAESFKLVDKIFEYISFQAISTSAELAKEKGSYSTFKGSMWSKGYVPIDTIEKLETARDEKLSTKNTSYLKLNWDKLIKKVKQGMRNATLMAVAPTANIGLVAGTSPGIDPRFAQMFSRNTLSGKYLEINFNLVRTLEEEGTWEETKEQILSSRGDIQAIEGISDKLKEIYKTSFEVGAQAFIEIAARAQKWTDQALSRNMYLDTRDTDQIMDIYFSAWEKGLKTTYYLHMKPRHSAEQSTVKVNKTSDLGKVGFGALKKVIPSLESKETTNTNKQEVINEDSITGNACPVDPQERLNCDSCQ
ncbi:MAG: ribonucleoside-diphosphate reductase subunit alpha [Candidatus Pacebacteria bacterium]|nr:ribonucleoside-diphosphate reductase subunit alpha [Candidatus Paceibacterota bacterium]